MWSTPKKCCGMSKLCTKNKFNMGNCIFPEFTFWLARQFETYTKESP